MYAPNLPAATSICQSTSRLPHHLHHDNDDGDDHGDDHGDDDDDAHDRILNAQSCATTTACWV